MMYVIYHKVSKKRMASQQGYESFGQKKTAKMVLTKACNGNSRLVKEDWIIDTMEAWVAADHEIEVISAFDGKTVCKIMASAKGGATDPSMERYWQT